MFLKNIKNTKKKEKKKKKKNSFEANIRFVLERMLRARVYKDIYNYRPLNHVERKIKITNYYRLNKRRRDLRINFSCYRRTSPYKNMFFRLDKRQKLLKERTIPFGLKKSLKAFEKKYGYVQKNRKKSKAKKRNLILNRFKRFISMKDFIGLKSFSDKIGRKIEKKYGINIKENRKKGVKIRIRVKRRRNRKPTKSRMKNKFFKNNASVSSRSLFLKFLKIKSRKKRFFPLMSRYYFIRNRTSLKFNFTYNKKRFKHLSKSQFYHKYKNKKQLYKKRFSFQIKKIFQNFYLKEKKEEKIM